MDGVEFRQVYRLLAQTWVHSFSAASKRWRGWRTPAWGVRTTRKHGLSSFWRAGSLGDGGMGGAATGVGGDGVCSRSGVRWGCAPERGLPCI